ncbi:MAG: AAA family ATPase [Actinobacteria bacterium]|nr:AAA family ATPase [Actinomycetota bacterium]
MSEQGNGDPGRSPQATFRSRPKESERTTRKPTGWWDRIRLFLLFSAGFGFLSWASFGDSGTFGLAVRRGMHSYWMLAGLAGLEVVRQTHYFVQEHVPAYYGLWKRFGQRSDSARNRIDPWVRYRLGRLTWILLLLWIVGVYVSSTYVFGPEQRHISPIEGVLRAPMLLFRALPSVLQYVFIISLGVMQFVAIFWFMSKGGVQTYMPDDIETRFSDVKGQDAVLDRVRENMIFLEDPESIERRGGYVPSGILLWGPPGTGKTLMAQAVAGETAKPFVFVEPGAFMNMFFGVGILKVKGLYRKLRKLATRYGGVIVFFDEADSLGNRGAISGGWNFEEASSPWAAVPACNGIAYVSEIGRESLFLMSPPGSLLERPRRRGIVMGGMGGGGMGTLQALLSEMDGLKKPRGFVNRVVRRLLGMKPKPPPKYRILHIFATNQPQVLDEAMLRPGRIDRKYRVGYPHVDGRKATFVYYLDRVKHELTDEQVTKLATITPYASGASIKDIVNEALVIAIRDGRDSVGWKDVIQAKQFKEHGLPDDWEYVERERHAVAVHEACHAVAAHLLPGTDVIDIATIERRGAVGGFVSPIPVEDLFTSWRSEDEIDIMTSLASLAGERLFFDGDNSRGVAGDMQNATRLAMLMEGIFAMGSTIGSIAVTPGSLRGAQPVEDGTDRQMLDSEFGKRVETRLQELYEKTWTLLDENRHHVLAVAHALEAHKTITGDDVVAVIEGGTGAIVDGRPYHDPRFRSELEEYHEAVVRAHKEYSGVEGRIPVPVPPAPVGAGVAAVGNGELGAAPPMPRIVKAAGLPDDEQGGDPAKRS